jgi:dienelactone hydrolase
MTTSEMADAMAGLAVLRSMPGVDRSRIAVAGHSFGGQLAILTAERDSTLRAALSFSAAAVVWGRSERVRGRLLEAIRAITVPLYLGYATDDNAEPGEVMGAELTRLGRVHHLAIYPSGGHNFVFFAAHPSDSDIFRFLSTNVPR